jgi:3-deoxy-D-manno-octulosonic-acid transferase
VYFIYSLLLTLGFILLLPRFAIDAWRTRKYVTGLSERLGKLPTLAQSDRPLIWLHCVSVGETEAARPLVDALREKFPSHRLVVSTTTVTGQQVAQRAFAEHSAAVFYFPIDWTWVVRRVLGSLRPAAVLIMETELWPNLLRECRHQSIPVALVNGRISQTSFGRYKLIGPFMRRVLNGISMALMQSDQDAGRIRDLGIPDERVLMCGNLKFDSASVSNNDAAKTESLRERFAFEENDRLIVAASTHAPEERIVIDAFKRIRLSHHNERIRLLIAPRHPERFDEVAELILSSGLKCARRSANLAESDTICDVVLLDSIGELRAVFPLADIAFIGGSITPHGGHNMLEPAAHGVCVVTGAHTHNFTAVTKALLEADAIVQLPELSPTDAAAALASIITNLLADSGRRREVGEKARAVCDRNRGATERAVNVIAALLDAPAPVEPIPFSAFHISAAK